MRTLALIPALAALAVAACLPAAEDEAPPAEGTDAVPAARPAPSPLPRQALLPEDLETARLTGELGCSFTEDGASGPLLVAMADVMDEARADGILRIGGSTVRLGAAEPGGFNAMVDGERFTSGDLTATVAVTSPEPLGGGESPPLAATLTLESPAFAPQQIAGQWTCGP